MPVMCLIKDPKKGAVHSEIFAFFAVIFTMYTVKGAIGWCMRSGLS